MVDNEMHIQSVIEFALIKEEPNVETERRADRELEAWKKDSLYTMHAPNHKLINIQLY